MLNYRCVETLSNYGQDKSYRAVAKSEKDVLHEKNTYCGSWQLHWDFI